MSMVTVTPGGSDSASRGVDDLIRHLKELLSRFADKDKGRHAGITDDTGVRARHSTKRNGIVEFVLITQDEFLIPIEYDLNQTSKDYIAGMVAEVTRQINAARKEEEGIMPPRIILPKRHGEVLH